MAPNRWGVLLIVLLYLCPVLANLDRMTKITYVLRPGPPGIYPQQHTLSTGSQQDRSRRMSSSPTLVHRQQPIIANNAAPALSGTRQLSMSRSSSLQHDLQRSPSLQQMQHDLHRSPSLQQMQHKLQG